MQHLLQLLMGSPTAFSKLEVTSVVVVAIVSGMVLGGLMGTSRRVAGVPLGYPIASGRTGASRTRRTTRSNVDRAFTGASGVAFAGWDPAGPYGPHRGSGQWVNLSGAATYLAPTTMLPLAALPSSASPQQVPLVPVQGPPHGQGPQAAGLGPVQGPLLPGQERLSPVSLLAPQSPAYLLAAPISPAIPLSPATPLVGQPGMWPSGGSPLVELQPVAFLPGVYQAATYRLDGTGRPDSEPAGGRIGPLWRLGNALFSAARGTTARAITPPAGSPPGTAARPGRHRASRSKRIRRSSINSDTWMRK